MTGKIIFKDFISREYVRKNQDKVFVFGDNDKKEGFGGQAKEMRGEPNAIGVSTKKSPDNRPESFYTDKDYLRNVYKMSDIFVYIETELVLGKDVVIPSAGLGTGLAQLDKKAPLTFQFLDNCLNYMVNKYGTNKERGG